MPRRKYKEERRREELIQWANPVNNTQHVTYLNALHTYHLTGSG